MKRKAQTATEYLIILAVVIVIALVVASLLGAFPGIGGTVTTNANQGYWTTTDIQVEAATMQYNTTSTNSVATVILKNGLAQDIQINNVKLGTEAGELESFVSPQTLKPGKTLTLNNLSLAATEVTGDIISYPLQVNYTDLELDVNFSFVGDRNLDLRVAEQTS